MTNQYLSHMEDNNESKNEDQYKTFLDPILTPFFTPIYNFFFHLGDLIANITIKIVLLVVVIIILYISYRAISWFGYFITPKYEGMTAKEWFYEYDALSGCVEANPHDAAQCL